MAVFRPVTADDGRTFHVNPDQVQCVEQLPDPKKSKIYFGRDDELVVELSAEAVISAFWGS